MSNYYAMEDSTVEEIASAIKSKTGDQRIYGYQFADKIRTINTNPQALFTSEVNQENVVEIDIDIPAYAFYHNEHITKVIIGENVTSIGVGAFNSCTKLKEVIWKAKHCVLAIPNNNVNEEIFYGAPIETFVFQNTETINQDDLTAVPDNLFRKYTAATTHRKYGYPQKIILCDTITTIGKYAFDGCNGLTTIVSESELNEDGTIPTELIGTVNFSDNIKTLDDCCFWYASLPEEIDLNKVSLINQSAFQYCYGLKNVEIPNGITAITDYVFSNCETLETIVLPDTVKRLGIATFSGCNNLKTINIPDNTVIYQSAFRNCHSLEELNLPSTTTIAVTSGTTYSTFYGCSSLKRIVLPEGMTALGEYLLRDCTSLTEVVIPSTIISTGPSAFSGCTSLTSVTIPENITSIGSNLFSNCSNLKEITILKTSGIITYGSSMLNGTKFTTAGQDAHIYVPSSLLSTYQSASGWNNATIKSYLTAYEPVTVIGDESEVEYLDGTETKYISKINTYSTISDFPDNGAEHEVYIALNEVSNVYIWTGTDYQVLQNTKYYTCKYGDPWNSFVVLHLTDFAVSGNNILNSAKSHFVAQNGKAVLESAQISGIVYSLKTI